MRKLATLIQVLKQLRIKHLLQKQQPANMLVIGFKRKQGNCG